MVKTGLLIQIGFVYEQKNLLWWFYRKPSPEIWWFLPAIGAIS